MQNLSDNYQLVDELLDWLPNSNPQEVLEYALNTEDYLQKVDSQFYNDLITEYRLQRFYFISGVLESNAHKLMTEYDLMIFLDNLSTYSLKSVIENSQKKYSNLYANPKQGYLQELQRFINGWDNLFYLIATPVYIQSLSYLKSILSLDLDEEQLEELSKSVYEVEKIIIEGFETHNFEKHIVNPEYKQSISNLLDFLAFLPTEVKSNLIDKRNLDKLFLMIKNISQVVDYLKTIDLYSDNQEIIDGYFEYLRNKAELEAILEYDIKNDPRLKVQIKDDPMVEQIMRLFEINKIRDGSTESALEKYIERLTPEQREKIKDKLAKIIPDCSDVQLVFDPLDVAYFIRAIRSTAIRGSKNDFINSLESRVTEQYWPDARRIMLMLAQIF